jgi:hypothetical protein
MLNVTELIVLITIRNMPKLDSLTDPGRNRRIVAMDVQKTGSQRRAYEH